jgi:hypothetical protein
VDGIGWEVPMSAIVTECAEGPIDKRWEIDMPEAKAPMVFGPVTVPGLEKESTS